MERRIQQVYAWLIESYSREDICQSASSLWGVSDRQIDRYIARAEAKLRDVFKADRETLIAKAVTQREFLYRKSLEAKKYWHCLEIAKDRDQLLRLYETVEDSIKTVLAAGYVLIDPTEDEGKDQAEDEQFTPQVVVESAPETGPSLPG